MIFNNFFLILFKQKNILCCLTCCSMVHSFNAQATYEKLEFEKKNSIKPFLCYQRKFITFNKDHFKKFKIIVTRNKFFLLNNFLKIINSRTLEKFSKLISTIKFVKLNLREQDVSMLIKMLMKLLKLTHHIQDAHRQVPRPSFPQIKIKLP